MRLLQRVADSAGKQRACEGRWIAVTFAMLWVVHFLIISSIARVVIPVLKTHFRTVAVDMTLRASNWPSIEWRHLSLSERKP